MGFSFCDFASWPLFMISVFLINLLVLLYFYLENTFFSSSFSLFLFHCRFLLWSFPVLVEQHKKNGLQLSPNLRWVGHVFWSPLRSLILECFAPCKLEVVCLNNCLGLMRVTALASAPPAIKFSGLRWCMITIPVQEWERMSFAPNLNLQVWELSSSH